MRKIAVFLLLVLLVWLALIWMREEGVPLNPRRLPFGSPDRSAPLLGPDGTWLSFRGMHGVKVKVWVAPPEAPGA